MPVLTKKNPFRIRLALLGAVVLAVGSFAGDLPTMRITTQNNANPQSQSGGSCGGNQGGWGISFSQTYNFPYVRVTDFQLSDPKGQANSLNRASKPDSIRLRGNSTSGVDKKPYRIKFGEKVSLFGKDPAKSWVLLANHYDGTFALNGMAFALGKKLGLEFTNSSILVDLYINNQYKGVYQLTEQIQSHKGRVDLKENKRGWLVEWDYHDPASDECLNWFTTGSNRYNLTTFIKSPELDDTSFTKNPRDSTQLRFVKTSIMNLVNKMSEGGFPTNGYRDLIDLQSFASYVLIQLVLDNFDFNSKAQTGFLPGSNYAYRVDSAVTTRIKAGPLWDFDLAAGVSSGGTTIGGWGGTGGFPAHYQTYQDPVVPRHPFYERLWADPAFKAKYLKTWNKHKNDFQNMGNYIDSISRVVRPSITGQGNSWANNSMTGSAQLTQQTFDTEVSKLKTWWTNRLTYVDQQLKSLNIDTTKDVIQNSPTPVVYRAGKLGGGVKLVKNGLNISPTASASVKVFTLSGAKVRHQSFSAGSHAVKLGDLPRGMYLVRLNLDGVKQSARVPVR
jgi:hypothetical protein